MRADVLDRDPAAAQVIAQRAFEREAGMVAADRDAPDLGDAAPGPQVRIDDVAHDAYRAGAQRVVRERRDVAAGPSVTVRRCRARARRLR